MSLEWSFVLKKGVSFLLMPLPIAFILLTIALWFLFRKSIKKATCYLFISMVWILVTSSAYTANHLLSHLERQYHPLQKVPDGVHYILLLGGERRKRAWEAIRLYNQNPKLKIITSGYSLYSTASNAEITATLLEESGVKKENILMQTEAKDTKEEALSIKKRLGASPFILVTSAYHMPRAIKLFKHEGLSPIPAPTDFYYEDKENPKSTLDGKQLKKTEKALHEYLGLLWIYIQNQRI